MEGEGVMDAQRRETERRIARSLGQIRENRSENRTFVVEGLDLMDMMVRATARRLAPDEFELWLAEVKDGLEGHLEYLARLKGLE